MTGTHGPIDKDLYTLMNGIAEALREVIPETCGFTLLVFRYDGLPGQRCNYISSADRESMVLLMEELVARFKGEHPDEHGGLN